jgi:hypothetical protein
MQRWRIERSACAHTLTCGDALGTRGSGSDPETHIDAQPQPFSPFRRRCLCWAVPIRHAEQAKMLERDRPSEAKCSRDRPMLLI